jgi:lipopolysaccharide/colanic/teichoic acid biosynthesis glycosyltransferase
MVSGYKVNERPQLWNVLVGEMSLVGPRPEDPTIASAWSPDVRKEILSIRPGLTGPASVAYHDEESRLNSASLMDDYLGCIQPDKLRLDHLYAPPSSH